MSFRSVISINLQSNFIEIALSCGCSPVKLLHIFRTLFLKDTHWEEVPSSKTPALTKSTNIGIWVVGKSNQVFIRGS